MAVVRRYRATEPAHLEPIEWWLQDAYFEVSDLRLAGRVLEIPMQRHPADEGPFPERTFIREGWLFRYYRQPYVRCTLTVREVERVDPPLPRLAEPGWFSRLEFASGERTITFHSPADSGFCVHVSRLDVQLEATDEVAYYREHGEGRWLEAESVGPAVD